MSTERAVLVLLLVVGTCAGAFLFLKTSSVEAEAQEAMRHAEVAADAARDADERERQHADDETGRNLTDALRERLAELGFPRDYTPGPNEAVLVGRAMGRGPAPEGSESLDGVPYEPLPLAKVTLHRIGDDGIADTAVETEASAQQDGWFAITVDRQWGRHVVVAADGFQPAQRDVAKSALAGGISDLGEVNLERLANVTIVVTTGRADLGETVSPVEGMDVRVHAGDEESPLATGVTDEEGRVTLEALPTQTLTFAGSLDPYAAFTQSTRVINDGQTIEVNVDAVGAVRLKVLTPGGAPVEAFQVALALQYPTYAPFQPKFVELVPDADGWATVEGVKTGKWDVYATAAGWGLGTTDGIVVEAGATTDVEVTLPHGFPVRGRVVAAGSGKPVSGAIVYSEKDLVPWSVATHTRDGFREGARAATCDANGYFDLKDLTAGTHKLTAMHPDFASHALQAVKVGEGGDVPEVKISLPLGATLTGHCYDENGSPAPGSQVLVIYFQDMRNNKKKAPRMATSDAKGAYRIEHLPAGQAGVIMTLTNPKEGQPPYSMKMASFRNGGQVTVDFGKAAVGTIVRGRVLKPDGQLVTDMTVMLISTVDIAQGKIPDFYQAAANSRGEYEIKGVPAGRYQVALAKSLKGSDFASGEFIEVPDGGVLENDVIVRGGAIRGSIASAETGTVPRNGEITLIDGEGQFSGHLRVEADGTFEFPVVKPGSYTAVVKADDHVVSAAEGIVVHDGQDTDVPEIVMAPGGRIVGSVVDASGAPVEGAQITLTTPSGETRPAWAFLSASDGAFAAESVPVGTYSVSATRSGLTFPGQQVTVTKGGTTTATIQAQ